MKLSMLLWLVTSCAALAATEEQINRTFAVQPGGRLVVEIDFGSITVTTNGADGELAADVWRKVTRKNKEAEDAFLKESPVQFLQDGETVTIRANAKMRNNWSWRGGNRNEAKYTIRVPARFNLQLSTAGGGISASDVSGDTKAHTSGGGLKFERLKGPLDGHTSGGGIRTVDCEGAIKIGTSGGGIDVSGGAGSLGAETSGGSIAVKNFRGPARVGTSGGGITVEKVAGKIEGSTSGGSVNAVLLSPLPDSVSLETSGGGITVRVPQDAAFILDAETSAGGVSSDLPVTVEGKLERSHLKGSVNGGGKSVRLHTSAGGIHIKKL